MLKMSLPREFGIPTNAIKVKDKKSDAVAYIWEKNGRYVQKTFFGKQSKPYAYYYYDKPEKREAAVKKAFESRQATLNYKQEQRDKRKATPRKTDVGIVYYTSWGYDQTNIDYYEVVELIGDKSAKVRPIGAVRTEETGWAQGKSIPDIGRYIGPAVTVRVTGDSFKVDGHYASRWDGMPKQWTAYA